MVARIRQLLELHQLSPTQFADRIGVGRPVMSHVLSERNEPSLKVVQRILATFPEVSPTWLLSGAGPMLTGTQAPAPPAAPGPTATPRVPRPRRPTAAPVAPAVVPEAESEGATRRLTEPRYAPAPGPEPPPTAAQPLPPPPPPVAGPPLASLPVAPAPELPLPAASLTKPIRRIVIFYRDGSFADYLPEQG